MARDWDRARGHISLWMTADNRLSLQQPGGGIADEKLGIATIDPQHFEALVAGLITDFE